MTILVIFTNLKLNIIFLELDHISKEKMELAT